MREKTAVFFKTNRNRGRNNFIGPQNGHSERILTVIFFFYFGSKIKAAEEKCVLKASNRVHITT